LKLVDFGLSNMYEEGETLKTACGSPCYAAPEMIAGKRYHGLKSDIWSSGVVLYAMICGYLPYEDPKTSNLYKKIMGAQYSLPKFLSHEAKDLIVKIFNVDPEKRYSIEQIRNHSWFQQHGFADNTLIKGLFPGKEKMPYNMPFLTNLVSEYGFDLEYSIKCLEANRHNHITATYHMISKKNTRNSSLRD
jgi:5'-AMP-activated protein kinase catalytic alpha subunit